MCDLKNYAKSYFSIVLFFLIWTARSYETNSICLNVIRVLKILVAQACARVYKSYTLDFGSNPPKKNCVWITDSKCTVTKKQL